MPGDRVFEKRELLVRPQTEWFSVKVKKRESEIRSFHQGLVISQIFTPEFDPRPSRYATSNPEIKIFKCSTE
jgi:hypothetical protein